MKDYFLPREINRILVPPLKCQGIKTKLVRFIAQTIKWHGKGRWIEPFLGSGVVLFNTKPARALVGDTNKHIIQFYKEVQSGKINSRIVKEYLEYNGTELARYGKPFYYEIRKQFNEDGDPLKLLFLNRSCYNGIMRFNSDGQFNVPFGHKPERFRRAYITKIVNQVQRIQELVKDKNWEFVVSDWKSLMTQANENDFVYMDPPYLGRHTDYYNDWNEQDAVELAQSAQALPCGFALSMWKENKYRINQHLEDHWHKFELKTFSHFYHVGSKESFRNKMTEALVLDSGSVAPSGEMPDKDSEIEKSKQLSLFT